VRRLRRSDRQCWPYLHMLPCEDSVDQIYNTDPIYICYQEKTQSIRYTIPTLSTYVSMRRLTSSDIQYRPYLHMLPREDAVDQINNTDPIYRCYPWEDSVYQIYNSDPIYICYPWEDSVDQIYNTDPIYICYLEKTQSIRYTKPTLSTYICMFQWEDSVHQIYNTDPIYICYQEMTQSIKYKIPILSTDVTHEKTQSIRYTIPTLSACFNEKTQFPRYTIPTLSTYDTMIRLSRSDIQYRPYLQMLQREVSVGQI
jgi:hypothetical protein